MTDLDAAAVMSRQGVAPAITPENAPYWEAASRNELIVEQCPECGLHIFPPRGVCRRCHARGLTWTLVQPPGILRSQTENHNSWLPGATGLYTFGLIEFPTYSNIRFVGFLTGFAEPPELDTEVGFAFIPTELGIHRLVITPCDARD